MVSGVRSRFLHNGVVRSGGIKTGLVRGRENDARYSFDLTLALIGDKVCSSSSSSSGGVDK